MESRSFLLAKKSGENAAKFIVNSHPKYFQKDVAEPHIPVRKDGLSFTKPSLATYHHIIHLFYHRGSSLKTSSLIIYDIMNELEGRKFSPRDLDDDKFFQLAMNVVFFPHSQALIDLLQALDVSNRLEMVPQIWKDSKEYGHTFRANLREEILMLLARDKHPPELQVAFADCAADIKSTYESQDALQTAHDWPANTLQYIAVLFLRGGRTQEAWKMLALFKKHNKIPRVAALVPSVLKPPVRTLTYCSTRKGKRKTVKSVVHRFLRLHSGLWLRRKAGYKKKLWKKSTARKKRLREFVFCNKTQSKLLDKMTTSFWKRRNWYADDPYLMYHDRTNLRV
ncbi:Pentatricopeptide repeat-containing protein 3, mitochondrial [Cricetulus griseus]|uniref:Pentatricopeptide repeat-containing protein 3, mitochondrial n=1 Tax=Cricetulus griseus TaxID=10029 RepID=G3HJK7_CRIGR|nr:Pentatricopeptide repeat-containing protein 3, mitochondrial [Cricetulus griseus]